MARESKGRTTRELAEKILLQEFGTSPKSKDAFAGKRLLEIVAAIDGRRYEEFPCYISARALGTGTEEELAHFLFEDCPTRSSIQLCCR